ncbi:MAG: amidohydrolase [Chloroflexi bacterium]|nr:amidohydrolase [Chloroflexota bacterium]
MERYPLLVDTDIHPVPSSQRIGEFLPEPWRTRFLSGSVGPGGQGYWNPNGVMRSDAVLEDGTRIETLPEALSRHFFDPYGIDYGILNTASMQISLSPEPDFSAAVVSAVNSVYLEDWLPADPRFRLSALIALADPDLAVKEIHRVGEHPGVVQILMPSATPLPLGNRFFHRIYAAAAEHGLPVAIHPGAEGVGMSGAPTVAGYPSSYLEWHTALAANYVGQLVSLVTEGVFVKFPTLKFVLIEGGVCWLPSILWRLDKNWKALRSTTPWLDRLPSEIIQEHVLLTTQPIEEPADPKHFAAIMEMFDAEKMLMFSSDYPHWDGDPPDFTARFFPKPMRPAVMGRNAQRLYRLPEVERVIES